MESDPDKADQQKPVGRWGRLALGAYLVLSSAFMLLLLLQRWPAVAQRSAAASQGSAGVDDHALMVAVAVLGALGGSLHGMSSFAMFVGNRTLVRSWTWWYVLRAPIGAIVACILYFVIRGGLLAPSANTSDFNPYGVAALAGLAGLMSETATMKLREVFEALFRPRDARKDAAATVSPPRIERATPGTIKAGASTTEITLSGALFRAGDEGFVGSRQIPLRFVSESETKATLAADLLASPGRLELYVRRAGDPKSASDPIRIQVEA